MIVKMLIMASCEVLILYTWVFWTNVLYTLRDYDKLSFPLSCPRSVHCAIMLSQAEYSDAFHFAVAQRVSELQAKNVLVKISDRRGQKRTTWQFA